MIVEYVHKIAVPTNEKFKRSDVHFNKNYNLILGSDLDAQREVRSALYEIIIDDRTKYITGFRCRHKQYESEFDFEQVKKQFADMHYKCWFRFMESHHLYRGSPYIIAGDMFDIFHYKDVEVMFSTLRNVQSFMFTQNTTVMDLFEFDSIDQVENTFSFYYGEDGKVMWKNITKEEASGFYAAYKEGYQSVSEILKTRGLW